MKQHGEYASGGQATAGPAAVDPAQRITAMLAAWVHRYGPLPAPCPYDFGDCARWWLDHMQEPQDAKEGLDAYGARCRSALFGFRKLKSDQDRLAVASGVCDDRVPYRGDDFSFYLSVVDETYLMRKDPETYRADAIQRMKCITRAAA